LRGENPITKEHVDNNLAVRKMLKERGVQPEALPPSEDVKKLSRKIESDGKKLVKSKKKKKDDK
jgi:DNA-damage-inducible protein D